MLTTDEERAKMRADAERIEALRQNATEGPWLRDMERTRTILSVSVSDGLIGGVLYNTNGGSDADFISATRTDPSAANVLRLLEEVSTLRKAGDAITTHLSFVEYQGVINNQAYYKMLYDRMIAAGFRIVDTKGGDA